MPSNFLRNDPSRYTDLISSSFFFNSSSLRATILFVKVSNPRKTTPKDPELIRRLSIYLLLNKTAFKSSIQVKKYIIILYYFKFKEIINLLIKHHVITII